MKLQNLYISLQYLEKIIRNRFEEDIAQQINPENIINSPTFSSDDHSHFTQFIIEHQLNLDELCVLTLALIPHIRPHLIDSIISEYIPQGGDYPALGGAKAGNHRGTIPTGETALYFLAGSNLEKRFQLQSIFHEEHLFSQKNILRLEAVRSGDPPMSGRIILDDDYINLFTLGKQKIPKMSANFPAQHITTELSWEDVVLHHHTLTQIKDLEIWVNHHNTLMEEWGMKNKLKPGYRALFYGPPGTGKTLTATLLGKYTQREVFRIDLSTVVSKYIGETEKNLATLFDKARNKNWILFFDEADALFGKRTNVRDAHDKYANQEVSYLLQRVEMYDGLTILSTNFKDNIDEAFTRRFNAMIYFPKPKPAERLLLWEKGFPQHIQFDHDLDFQQISKSYDLTGSHIMNIIQYTCLKAIDLQTHIINKELLISGIQVEMAKEGKTV